MDLKKCAVECHATYLFGFSAFLVFIYFCVYTPKYCKSVFLEKNINVMQHVSYYTFPLFVKFHTVDCCQLLNFIQTRELMVRIPNRNRLIDSWPTWPRFLAEINSHLGLIWSLLNFSDNHMLSI